MNQAADPAVADHAGQGRAESPSAAPGSPILPVSAVVAALACVATVDVLWIQHALGWQHFRPELFLAPFLLCALAVLTACATAAARLFRRQARGRDLLWLALALAPVGLWTAVGVVGGWNWSKRHVPHTLLMDLARRTGASLMEGEATWRYPQRAGKRCRMFGGSGEHAAADVAAMDAYLIGLEEFTGQTLREPIHWVRGNLLGVGGLSLYGLALGSDPVQLAKNRPGWTPAAGVLTDFDRHEAAHAFMAQVLPPSAQPPTILSEGWANALGHGDIGPSTPANPNIAAQEPRSAARNALDPADRASLTTLFGPDWYDQDSGLVYIYGRELVGYLVERYGVRRCLELCAQIRPDRVEPVFQEIYGTTLPEIERSLFATDADADNMERTTEPSAEPALTRDPNEPDRS